MSFAVELRLGDRCLLLQAPVQRVTTESERLFHPSPPHPMGPCRGDGDLAAQQGTGSGHLGRLNAASRGNVPTHAARRGHARQGPRPRVGGYGVGQLRSSAGGAGRVRPVDGCFHGGRHGGYDSSPAHLIDQATNPQTSKISWLLAATTDENGGGARPSSALLGAVEPVSKIDAGAFPAPRTVCCEHAFQRRFLGRPRRAPVAIRAAIHKVGGGGGGTGGGTL